MVLPGEKDFMETGPERSKNLHNFTLPNLKWGSQRHLRCMKVDLARGGGGGVSGAGDHRLRRRSSHLKFETLTEAIPVQFGYADERSNNQHRRLRTAPSRSAGNGSEEGIEEFREKIMSDLRTVADKITESIFRKQALGDEEQTDGGRQEKERRRDKQEEKEKETQKDREVSPVMAAAAAAEARPWNLRTRRAACKAPIPGAGNSNGNQYNGFNHNNNNKGLKIEERRVDSSSLRNDSEKSPRVRERGGVTVAMAGVGTKERPKFSSRLSRKEIEEDFMELLGHRPPRRPKKRPKTVQRQLDFLFPGLYLTEVTLDTYKIPESVENGKR
ncbi:PREDICTED: uncharacterized protein LOC104808336 [Tarenaya hassleriana]|uniref:uncharacterized protein LOC104808336 n=1 Tax=Tarenaya hassleriana TaxID=28532 RepID=UPI00053C6D69|nr:PREDICTED: uncharacterized protein LOC104808336 [Tarenaya hassleriana]